MNLFRFLSFRPGNFRLTGVELSALCTGQTPWRDLIGLLFIQIRPYRHFNIRPLYSNIVTQAVVDSMADQRSKIMGYATPR